MCTVRAPNIIVKLREREGQRVDLGRSLITHIGPISNIPSIGPTYLSFTIQAINIEKKEKYRWKVVVVVVGDNQI